MADKTETLLFLIDIQVRGSRALRALDAELDAVAAAHERRLLALNQALSPGNGGGGFAPLPPAGNGGNGGNGGTTVIAGRGGPQDTGLVGIRGPHRPGSKENPPVVVLESGQAAGLGSLAAALTDARKGDQPTVKAVPAPASASDQPVIARQQAQILASLLAARRVQQAIGSNGSSPLIVNGNGGRSLGTLTAASAAQRLGVPVTRVRDLVASGQLAGAQKTGGQWSIPEQAVLDMAAAGGGGSGGVRPPIIVGHGGGGSGGGFLSRLGWGGGIAGMAAAGSAASFAGLGFEHILFTALGLAGSATAAAGGAGLLGLGSLGKLGVGGGSDLAAMTTTIAQVKNLNKAYENLQNAVLTYGKGSAQAKQAQQQLNGQLAQLKSDFGPQAAAAINSVALSLQALSDNWGHSLAPAMVQATHIIQQALGTANTFIPMIGQAATRNLSIINQGLKPLFAWLQGPQGIQIFNDLENAFAKDLPTAVHAGSQALELLLRVIDIASQDTGGFVAHLDHLFTRLNGLDSATLGREIGKLVDDFRLWDHFLGLVGKDVFLLFHQDVGTGNSIISALSGMLTHLQAYEKSAKGQAQIQNIFMVHKTEILELIHIFGELSKAFAGVYLAVAPAAVTVMNDVVLPVLSAVAKALAAIAHSSPLAADALGALLIGAKFGGWAAVLGGLRGSTQWLLGTGAAGAAAKAARGAGVVGTVAEGAGGAALATGLPGAIEGGSLAVGGGLEALGLGGLGLGVVGAGGALAAALPIVIPAAVAAAGVYLLAHGLFGGGRPVATATPGALRVPQNVSSYRGGRGGPAFALPGGLSQDTLNVKEVGNFAHYSATQLEALIAEMKQANGLKLNGIDVPKKQLIALAEAALKAKDAWNQSFDTAWSAVNKFYRNTSRTLPALYDDFNSNMKLIAHTMGLNSEQGRKLVADNIAKMVTAVTQGMLSGKISATDGMTAIRQALGQGMKDNAITWDTEWKDMIDTVGLLYANHKLTTQQWLADVRSIQKTGLGHIQADARSSYQHRFADLKKQYDDGLITHGQFLSRIHAAQLAANAQAKGDWGKFDSSIALAMIAAGTAAGQGITQITDEVNAALGLFGASKIPLAAIQKATPGQLAAVANGTVSPGGLLSPHATGGKITSPLIMVGEEAPAHPEMVIASNPAYRDRNLGLWAEAGRMLGVPGFAMGGIVAPTVLGGAGASPALARAGLGKVASAANAFLGAHTPTGGGALAGAFSGQGGPPTANQALGRQMMLAAGWGADQWPFLLALWNQESGWNANAVNSSSGAYGIPQSLGHGHPFNLGDAPAQIAWGLNYIRGTYGSPAAAWGHERAFNWYARGGIIGRMLRMAQGGGYPVVTGGSRQPTSWHPAGGGGIPNWFPVGISNSAIAANMNGIANEFQGYQTNFGNVGSLASILQGLAPGTSLQSIGLGSAASLKAAGLSRKQALGLIGGGPGSFGVLQQIDQGEISKYKTEDAKLRQLYRDALHNHNKKLQKTLLDQMQAVDSALAQVVSDKQQAFIAEIQAKAQAFSDQSAAIGSTLSSLQGIEGLAPGTSLAGLGLSPGILATLGLTGAQGAVGTGLSYFQSLAQSQGGTLTAAQLAQAQSGVSSQNSLLTQQETPIENELAYYQSVLPSLTGSDRTNAISAMQQLVQTLLGLQGTIDTNNQSLTQLTQATNANTTATAAMTGTVAYTFQGNPYTPASLSSDTTIGLGVGN